jgi:hypothetical protein
MPQFLLKLQQYSAILTRLPMLLPKTPFLFILEFTR